MTPAWARAMPSESPTDPAPTMTTSAVIGIERSIAAVATESRPDIVIVVMATPVVPQRQAWWRDGNTAPLNGLASTGATNAMTRGPCLGIEG